MLAVKKISRWIIYSIILVLTVMLITAGIISFFIFPNINEYKDDISATISNKIGLKTTIGNIVTDWDGISPRVVISEIDIYDEKNVSALHLENVNGTFSWLSIPMLHPHLSNIAVSNPKLTIQRKTNGDISVAGITLTGNGEPDLANWLLSQEKINIKNASLIWHDEMRQAPALSLDQVDFKLTNPAWRKIFGQHLFTLSALPSVGTKKPIAINGDFFGRDISRMNEWHGNINLSSQEIGLTIWKAWIDYPIDLESGFGKADLSLSFSNNKINKLNTNFSIKDFAGKIDQEKALFEAEQFSGIVSWEQSAKTTTFSAQSLNLIRKDGQNIYNGSGLVSYRTKNKQRWFDASATLDGINLDFLKTVSDTFKLPTSTRQLIADLSLAGELSNVAFNWQGTLQDPQEYRLRSSFSSLSMNPYKEIPGFENISGNIDANEDNGLLELAARNASINMQNVLRWPIPVNTLDGKITWNRRNDKLKVIAKDIAIANDHISGSVNANYNMNGIKGGYLDLSGNFDNGDIQYAPFYYPKILDDTTTNWLDTSIISGKANDVQLTVKGYLDDFPYVDKQNKLDTKLGLFRVTARVSEALLEYGKSWPKINNLGLDLLFEGNRMELNANTGKILGFNITKSKATIPVLDSNGKNNQVLNIISEGNGAITDSIKFINSSPVQEVTLGFTDNLKTAGQGKLNLDLSIPLNNIEQSTYKGQYHIADGTLYADDEIGLPEIRHIFGTLRFDKSGIYADTMKADVFGEPTQVNINTASDSTINIDAQGLVNEVGLQEALPNMLTHSLAGNADWNANIAIKKPILNLNIRSSLVGMAVNLPAPLGKTAEQDAGFSITKKQQLANEDTIEINYNQVVSSTILRTEKAGELVIQSGDVAINTPSKTPTNPGLNLRGEFDYVNVDEWLEIANKPNNKNSHAPNDLTFSTADISIQKLDLFKRSFSPTKITANPKEKHIKVAISSQELEGDIEWQSSTDIQDAGKVIARFKKLHIPSKDQDEEENDLEKKDIKRLDRKYPALDIQAEDFKLGKKALGAFSLNAFAQDEDWVIQSLEISNPKSTLSAEGTWHNWSRSPNTNLNFTLSTSDIGDTLKRFGQVGAVKDGVAVITGKLQWPGSPHEFETEDLSGEFTLGASKGQILKVQPGVGRLFGLLTLQSLPRRLTLDFKDLFSEGFAFDEISGTATIDSGIMRSDDFFMTGPAAETEIKGQTNLKTETQELNVKVIPHISDSVSLAALAGGPLAGAAAWLAQKILKDPLNKIAQSEYAITGTWDNPVEVDAKTETEEVKQSNPLTAQEN